MTNENDQTIVRPIDNPDSEATQDGFEQALEAGFDARTIAQSDLGMTIKQNRPEEAPKPQPADESGRTLQRSASPEPTDATIVRPQAQLPAQEDAGATILRPAQAPATSDQTIATPTRQDTQAFKATVATGTQGTVAAGTRGVTTNGASSQGPAGQSRSQSLSGRSQSVSLRMGESAISINIHPRTIAKSRGAAEVKYDGQTPGTGEFTDFELLDQLGEGGMGVVYSARQSSIDRPVALKMIKGAALTSPTARAKFLQEAVVTGDLDHPNIVTVHDLGADAAGNVFYAMKKVVGIGWNKAIKEKSRQENIDILLRVCDAIAFAHSRGVIHRDLKPENTMLGSFGEVLVMDWGLAVAVNERGKAERINANTGISGTPAYLAPEMAVPGRWREIGFGSDIYLLGAILYEILTGHRPHGGRNVGECLRNAARNVIRESEVTGELMDIARKAMADTPAGRYATVQELQAAIREYLAHSESVLLEQKAQADLKLAQQSKQHEDFSKALFGFRQACEMWSGNHPAHIGLQETVQLYATAAMQSGDLDLALSLVSRDKFPACAELTGRIEAAIRQREEQKRRNRLLRNGVIALSAAVLMIAVIAALWINRARIEADHRRAEAEQARNDATAQRNKAESARQEADRQRAAAELAKLQAEKALEAEKAAREAEIIAQKNEAIAKTEAKESKEVIQKRDELAANIWWQIAPAFAVQRQAEAARIAGLPAQRSFDLGKGAKLTLALIPAGSFGMGSPIGESGRLSEENLHRVKISRPFYLAKQELTLRQFRAMGGVMEAPAGDPDEAAGKNAEDLPVGGLSWNDVTKTVLPALNKIAPAGWKFQLPTEAQWEWACRAGTNTEYHTGSGEVALRKAGFSGLDNLTGAAAAGKREPNAWGLSDMHGNLAEWCADAYRKDCYLIPAAEEIVDPNATDTGSGKRVVRGGSWANTEQQCRSAYRSYASPDSHYQFIGVRLALVQDAPSGR